MENLKKKSINNLHHFEKLRILNIVKHRIHQPKRKDKLFNLNGKSIKINSFKMKNNLLILLFI